MSPATAPADWPRRLLIIGCGQMGGAMLAGWLRAGLAPARFTVVDRRMTAPPPGVTLLREPPDGGDFDAVLLGMKPQALDAAVAALTPLIAGRTVVLSMLAGVELASLAARFPAAGGIARLMPNLAVAIGKGPVGVVGGPGTETLRPAITALLAPLGGAEWLETEAEADIDGFAALSGCGLAFVYRFIDALAAAGGALGIAPESAARLALATVAAAGTLAASSDAPPAELARRVASRGGMTQAGLDVLDSDEALVTLLRATLRAARDRGRAMAAAARPG